MNTCALITGASSGIGKEIARVHAEHGGNLIITARREDALNALKTELETTHNISVTVIVADLGTPAGVEHLCSEISAQNLSVDYLINNAGFGGYGLFYERKDEEDQAMIDLNIKTLTTLCHTFLPAMVSRNAGRVLNVASTAGMLPGPYQAVYFATKAYVLSLSEAMAHELRHSKVTVTALCPGPVATEFAHTAELDQSLGFKNPKSARSVAVCGYNAMLAGKSYVVNERKLWVMLRFIAPLMPRALLCKLSEMSMKKPG